MRLRLTSFRRHVLLFGAVLAALAILSAPAAGDSSQYPTTLYLSGIASSTLPGAYQLVTSQGVSQNVPIMTPYALPAPTATLCIDPVACAGTGPLTSASGVPYSYRYTEVDAGGETPPSTSATAPQVTGGWITVGNLPTGVTVRLYRATGPTGLFYEVAQLTNNSSSTFVDGDSPDPNGMNGGVLLPQAQTRTMTLGTGWFEYQPGQAISTTVASNGCTIASGINACAVSSPGFDSKGWVVDGAGNVHFPVNTTWTITTKVTTPGSNNGTASLGVGMWTVNGGSAVQQWVDPTCASGSTCAVSNGVTEQPGLNTSTNIARSSTTGSPVTTSFTIPTAITLGAGDHLYFEFYRDQTVGSTGTTTSTLNAYDGIAQITTSKRAWTLPTSPALVTPAASAVTNSATLTSTFSDPDAGDTGTLAFNLCSDAACSTVLSSSTSTALANGANASWTPASLADATYWWQVQATDTSGGQSSWTTPQSFTLDTIAPNTTIGTSPASPSNSTTATFTFGSTDSGSTFQCQLDTRSYAACTSPKSYSGLANGSHTFNVKATDAAGNTDATPDSTTWTVDTTAPRTTVDTGPTSVTSLNVATFTFSSNKSGSTFQCQLDRDGYTPCHSPQSYGHLDDGSHMFNVRATDAVGNTDPSPAAFEWTIDTTTPFVVGQNPNPVTPVVGTGDPTKTSGGAGSGAKASFAVHIAGARTLSCTQTRKLALHIKLDQKASVAVRFRTLAGLSLGMTKPAHMRAGSRTLKLHLPFLPKRGRTYRLIVTASSSGEIVKDEIKLKIKNAHARMTASSVTCG